jgi:hypothetical protein
MILNWIFWNVPALYVKRYIFWLFIMLFGFPYLFGFYYTQLGVVINILWYDIIFYVFVRIREGINDGEM